MGPQSRRWIAATALFLAASFLSGCLLGNKGTPVFVDTRAGDYWSGKGLLVEVSPDQTQCHVAARDDALVVRKRWVDCNHVHPRNR